MSKEEVEVKKTEKETDTLNKSKSTEPKIEEWRKTERLSGNRCGRFIIGEERPYTEEEKREANKDLN